MIAVKGLSSELWDTTTFMIFHPKGAEKSLKMEQNYKGDDFEQWSIKKVPGENNSVIICGMVKQGQYGFNYGFKYVE